MVADGCRGDGALPRRSPVAVGWAVGIAAQLLWFAYSITAEQWGFLVSCFAYGWVYARNFVRWRREDALPPARPAEAGQ